ncbi:hypothetical protein AB3N58_10405 [Leptospira sp. WS60.C2]
MKRLSRKEIFYISFALYITGIILMSPLIFKAYNLFSVRNWKKVYCPIIQEETQVNYLMNSATRYNKTSYSNTTIAISSYSYKIKLPNGNLVDFQSNRYYTDEILVYFDEFNNYKIVEANYQLITILSFFLGIFLIFYSNIKSKELSISAYD